MRRFLPIVLVVIALALTPPIAAAQAPASPGRVLGAGARVRIILTQPVSAITGVVMSSDRDTIVVTTDTDGRTVAVPVVNVTRIDVSAGTRTNFRRGAAVGLVGGAAVGALAGLATYQKANCGRDTLFCIDLGPGVDAMLGAGVGALAGALVGTLLGSRSTELWDPVTGTLNGGTRLGIAPAPRGAVAVSASLTF